MKDGFIVLKMESANPERSRVTHLQAGPCKLTVSYVYKSQTHLPYRHENRLSCDSGFWGGLRDGTQPLNLSISKTVGEVIIHRADRLHVRINNGRTNEREPAAFEILAKRVRLT